MNDYHKKGNNRGGAGKYGYTKGPKKLYDTPCTTCGNNAQVPFKPNGEKPVFCRDCFSKQNGGNNNRSGYQDRKPARKQFNTRTLDRPGTPAPTIDVVTLQKQIDALHEKMDILLDVILEAVGEEITDEMVEETKPKKETKKNTKKKDDKDLKETLKSIDALPKEKKAKKAPAKKTTKKADKKTTKKK